MDVHAETARLRKNRVFEPYPEATHLVRLDDAEDAVRRAFAAGRAAAQPVPLSDLSACEACGHVQAEPNWCHKCRHRTTTPGWARALMDAERAAGRAAERAATCETAVAHAAVAAWRLAAVSPVPPDGENPLRVDVRPADDRYFVWVCPTHGIISEDELVEGVNWQNPNPDGDIYTDEFFCQRQHGEGEDHRAESYDLAPAFAAGRAAASPDPPDTFGTGSLYDRERPAASPDSPDDRESLIAAEFFAAGMRAASPDERDGER